MVWVLELCEVAGNFFYGVVVVVVGVVVVGVGVGVVGVVVGK